MRILNIDLTPEEYCVKHLLYESVAKELGTTPDEVAHVEVKRRSLDSRRGIRYHAEVEVYLQGEQYETPHYTTHYQDCRNGKPVVIVGAGPAGLFAAMRGLELGLKPIIVERGKEVKKRKLDIARIPQEGVVNGNSNWCFGEGGAGTYSDGKLYTRSTKRGDVSGIMRRFVELGTDPEILIDAHAHIGTDKLSNIIATTRQTILEHGGEYHFETRMTDLIVEDGVVKGIVTDKGDKIEGIAVILATGHSARDVYELFATKGWKIEAKPFALGVRVEHPQALINSIQYHSRHYSKYLPPANYALTTQVNGHGVFSFCMCPGGVIVPASTGAEQQVVNGMSNSKRNSPFANSGIAVTVGLDDIPKYAHYGELALLRFQQEIEQKAYFATGGGLKAPCQRLTDFCNSKASSRLNKCNYLGECVSSRVDEILPKFITRCLQQGFKDFDKKMRGFYTEEASVIAVESRTSSPVRVPRDKETLQHVELKNLYPCGEGAGYAGGIVSSALDGIKCMDMIANSIER